MAALLLSNAVLDVLLAVVVLRAERQRRENQLLALAALLDATRDGLLALFVTRGFAISDQLPMQMCLVARVLVLYPVLEFSYAFPSGRKPPAWARWLAGSAVLVGALAALHPASARWASQWFVVLIFFAAFFAATVNAARRNFLLLRHESSASGELVILSALAVRFTVAMVTCVVIRPFFPGAVPAAFTLEGVISMATFAVVVNVVLRYRFFNVRGLVAEAALYGGLTLSGLGLVVMAADQAARLSEPGLRGVALSLVVLLPLGGWLLLSHYAPPLRSLFLYPFHARRRELKSTLERLAQELEQIGDATAACEQTSNALASLSRGTVVLWRAQRLGEPGWRSNISGPVLPHELTEYLERAQVASIHRRSLADGTLLQAFAMLGADALVAVRVQSNVLCAFAIKSALVDQDLLDSAVNLAQGLGNKLAHLAMQEYASELQTKLEATRRLTTLGSFVAAVAHDIRTPLTSVKMNVEMIRGSGSLDPNMVECADIALVELRRMNDYISGMLDYVKPVQLRSVELDVQDLIEETTRTLQPLFESRKIQLNWERADISPPTVVRVDAARMRQVLVNLLENAAYASMPGKTIVIAAAPLERKRVAIRIRDHGQGIEPGNLDRIFEPFFTTREEGTGLGLAIVNKLVRAHDGEIRVESELNAGSTFTVILPAYIERASVSSRRASSGSPPAA